MSERYLIVNTEREEYLDPGAFGEHETFLGWGGFAGGENGAMMAVAMLLLQTRDGEWKGRWSQQGMVLAAQGAPRHVDIPPRTSTHIANVEETDVGWFTQVAPTANLYAAARAFYTDISADCIRVLCQDPYTLKALVARGAPEAIRIAREER